jgi:hypothetical protein
LSFNPITPRQLFGRVKLELARIARDTDLGYYLAFSPSFRHPYESLKRCQPSFHYTPKARERRPDQPTNLHENETLAHRQMRPIALHVGRNSPSRIEAPAFF